MTWNEIEIAGWGRALRGKAEAARPERAGLLAGLSGEGPAIGMRRSYGDEMLNTGGRVIDMTRLDRMLGFDSASGELTVEAGARLGDIARAFAPRGWLPAVMPGTGFCTVGGAIANDVHGKNHHGAGSFGQHVAAITLIRNGKAGTITPETDPDLFRATLGGLGQTGIIAQATLRLTPCKGDLMMVTERRVADWDEHVALLEASTAPYSVGWIDATARGASLGRGILEEGETGSGLVPKRKPGKKVPFDAPGWALSSPIVRMFNNAYWRRVPRSGRTVVKPITDFFFPLDRIRDWNRLYGKRGFHQFQCVVPTESVDALRGMLSQIAEAGIASPLSVLKRMGPGRAGMLSFPMEGFTLAVDFPNRPGAAPLIEMLHGLTEAAGGRVYLAKDSLLRPDRLPGMYPELAEWRKVVAKADPEGHLQTDMTRRLKLRS
ncbi:FAD-binding oxidoreductase [Frigidibacter sp. ROC022]|uniref:FAD-binding oxidoreductase n=1 Tax=Frigidibacter sp. ROC022 TaxID=2971796 RepID=UPI00215A8423|nr:FAD-binding oxidoreductase [Frigidibacter sp. ROC022]MCR8724009.1 FAD-binding oxidoreductase [Frigidibacter sp. ROC022]